MRPPQPAGVTEVAFGRPKWNADEGEDRFRRSIYTFVKRSAPFAMLQTFDAPSGESCTVRRDESNTPLQALTLLNDVMFIEASQALGRLVAARGGNDRHKIDYAFRRALTRPADEEETGTLVMFVAGQRKRLVAGELDPAVITGADGDVDRQLLIEQATWTTLARVLFGLDEMITRN